ncbi:hypothetical protein, partial [Escherichia coli]|uniref:hypothetical protein n=1 Tax=Escherichia coli TaxID=562 RepID=UPI001F0432D0
WKGWAISHRQKQKKLIMLPSETMIWQPEFTDKTLSRKPGAVHFSLSSRCARGQRNLLYYKGFSGSSTLMFTVFSYTNKKPESGRIPNPGSDSRLT